MKKVNHQTFESYNNRDVNTIAGMPLCRRSSSIQPYLEKAIYVTAGVSGDPTWNFTLISSLSKQHTVPVSSRWGPLSLTLPRRCRHTIVPSIYRIPQCCPCKQRYFLRYYSKKHPISVLSLKFLTIFKFRISSGDFRQFKNV